jgi:replicative DNA helicase
MSNIAAEKILLAGLAAHPDKVFEYVEYLGEDDFTHAATSVTYQALRSLIITKESKTVTKAKLVAEAKSLGHENYLSITKNGQWLDEMLAERVSLPEVDNYFQAVKRQTILSSYAKSFSDMKDYVTTTQDPLLKVIGNVEESILGNVFLLDRGENQMVPLNKDIWAFIENLADNPGHVGIDVGYPSWQERVGQIRNGAITFVAATAKAGKSQFALRVALSAAYKHNLPVLLCDSELNHNDQRIRLAGMIAKVPYQYIETGFWKLSPDQLKSKGITDEKVILEIQEAGKRLKDPELRRRVDALPIHYQSISGMDMKEVIPHIRRWLLSTVKPDRKTMTPQCLIVYDYIKLARLDEVIKGAAEWQQHGINVAMLHDLMKKYNVPCLAFGQTNNELDDGFKCIAGGKRISENVTSISYLKRKTDDELSFDSAGSHYIKIFGARYGAAVHGGHINFDADLSIGQFTEIGVSAINFNAERQRRLEAWRNRGQEDDDEDAD